MKKLGAQKKLMLNQETVRRLDFGLLRVGGGEASDMGPSMVPGCQDIRMPSIDGTC